MAVSTVSSITGQGWQLIATNTTTSGTSSTFSGLAGYKRFMLSWKGIGLSSGLGINIRFNGDSTNNNYASIYYGLGGSSLAAESTKILLSSVGNNAANFSGTLYIDNVLEAAPKMIDGIGQEGGGSAAGVIKGTWVSESAITSIALLGGTFSAGTVSLYGIAA